MKQLIVFTLLFIFSQQLAYCQMITGAIHTENSEPIQDVVVTLSTPTDTFTYLTGIEGIYQFMVAPGTTGTISLHRPTTGQEIFNGLSPYDYVLIQYLIVGNYTGLNFSVYQILAGDTNNDGYWSTYDVTQIKALLLQTESSYVNSPHWKFIQDAYEFDDPEHPILTEEASSVQLTDIINGTKSGNFIGIRTGDVNGSVIPHD